VRTEFTQVNASARKRLDFFQEASGDVERTKSSSRAGSTMRNNSSRATPARYFATKRRDFSIIR
jgi:hypothetical protein